MRAVGGSAHQGQIQAAVLEMSAIAALIKYGEVFVVRLHGCEAMRNKFSAVPEQFLCSESSLSDYLSGVRHRDTDLYHFVDIVEEECNVNIHIVIVLVNAVFYAGLAVFFLKKGLNPNVNVDVIDYQKSFKNGKYSQRFLG